MINKTEVADVCKSWGEDYEHLFTKVGEVFGRKESRAKAKGYVRALMSDVKRKNSWQLAE